jgi:hypothetical protein
MIEYLGGEECAFFLAVLVICSFDPFLKHKVWLISKRLRSRGVANLWFKVFRVQSYIENQGYAFHVS